MLRNAKLGRWLLAALFIVILDQSSKIYIIKHFALHKKVAIMPFFNLSLAFNNGAAFGLLAQEHGWQRWVFMLIAVVISAIIIGWIAFARDQNDWDSFALSCILGGALGNLCDRILLGHVVDFIDFYVGSWHWYTFNIADIAICIGSAIIIFTSFKRS